MKICSACTHRFAAAEWTCPRCNWTPKIRDGIRILMPTTTDGAPGFDAKFFDEVDQAERDHFWFHGRMALIEHVLDRFFPRAESFLDVGSGTGHVVAALRRRWPSMQITAAEAFADGLRLTAQRAAGVELVQTDALHLPYDAEFDAVAAFDVIEHIADDRAALVSIAAKLKSTGKFVMTVPAHQWMWSAHDVVNHHKRRYSKRGLKALIDGSPMKLELVGYFNSLLFPVAVAQRAASRVRRAEDADVRLPPAPLNSALEKIFAAERYLVGRLPLPPGLSLFAVASAR